MLTIRLADLKAALGDSTWLDGREFTVGDLLMVSVLGGLRSIGVLDGFEALAAYVARGEDRPAHRRPMADYMAVFGGNAAGSAQRGMAQEHQRVAGA